jgi:hypothetical protein
MPPPRRRNPYCRRICPVLIPLIAISVFARCATTDVQLSQTTPVARSSREAIAVVLDHFWFSPDMELIGESVAECVANATARKTPDMRVFSPADFRNAVFPGFDAAAVPCTPETLWLLLDHQEFRSRLESHGIRYLVLLRGGTKATRYGGFDCAGGFGAGG